MQFSERLFHFSDDSDVVMLNYSSDSSDFSETDIHVCNEKCINVKIREVLDPSYGMYVWPCAPVLAQYVWYNRILVKGKRVLELGAGTALPLIVAAKCGAYSILTDGENFDHTLEYGQHNLHCNNIPPDSTEIRGITWGVFSPNLIGLKPVDIILGSDIFYEPDDFEDIIVTVAYIMEKNQNTEFWCTYQERSSDWNIDKLLLKWGLYCEEVALEEFGANESNLAGSNLPGSSTIHLLIFRLKNKEHLELEVIMEVSHF